MTSTFDPDRWERLEQLFHKANELDPDSVEAFVAEVEANDPALGRELRAMVSRDGADLPDVLEGASALLHDEAPASMPEQVGSYRIERELGRGGMGVVYLGVRHADDFEHRVAIKMLPSALYDPQQLGRFKNERQILASLQHPGIARLLDGGTTESGVPYVVMDFVDGERIDDYCDRVHASLEDRLQLFLQVCDAVSHAHRRLVVHRDIKPNNILIDGEGDPKLLDFGIAKLVDPAESDLDVTSTRIMTLSYASPEQIEGAPVGTGTDVYALGALLYQLLTRERPHGSSDTSAPELARRILEDDPQRPSVRANDARLSGDLDTICLKALQREPEHRYATVDALAADVVAHLESRPIEAVAPTAGYRVRKFVRRNRAASLAAAVALVAMVVGASGLVVGLLRAQAAETAALEEAEVARAVTEFLVNSFNQAGADSLLGMRLSAIQVLDRGSERIDQDLAERPAIRVRLKRAMAESYMGLGQMVTARRLIAESLETLDADDPQRPVLLSLKAVTDRYAENTAESRAAVDEAMSLILPQVDTTSAEAFRSTPELSGALMRVLQEAALVNATEADYEEARMWAERAVRLRQLYGDTLSERSSLAVATLGSVHAFAGRWEEADPLLTQAYGWAQQILPQDHPTTLNIGSIVATMLVRTGRFDSAMVVFNDLLPRQISLLGERHPNVVQTKLNMGTALMDLDEVRSQDMLEDALEGFRALNGPTSLSTTSPMLNLGLIAQSQGRLRDALGYYQAVADIRSEQLGSDNPRTAYGLMGVANMQRQLGDLSDSANNFEAAFVVLRPLNQVPSAALRDYAEVLRGLGRTEDARIAEDEAEAMDRAREEERARAAQESAGEEENSGSNDA